MRHFGFFLTIVLSIYLTMNLVVFTWIRTVFQLKNVSLWIFCSIFSLLIASFPLGRWSLSTHFNSFGRIFLLIGHYWLGILFCLFSFSLAGFFLLLLNKIFIRKNLFITAGGRYILVSATVGFMIALTILIVHGSHLVRYPILRSFKIAIPSSFRMTQPMRIVQLSDLHIDELRPSEWFLGIVDRANALKPDLIVLTGDVIDGKPDRLGDFIPLLKSLRATHGVFAITGNHEYYIGVEASSAFLESCQITMLRNRHVVVADQINLLGLDDPSGVGGFGERPPDYLQIQLELDPNLPVVLLKHQPFVETNLRQPTLLQLSGHTHNGQIWPFTLLTGMMFEHQAGMHTMNDTSFLYTSSGTGIWGPPFRILTESEISVFDLHQSTQPIDSSSQF